MQAFFFTYREKLYNKNENTNRKGRKRKQCQFQYMTAQKTRRPNNA